MEQQKTLVKEIQISSTLVQLDYIFNFSTLYKISFPIPYYTPSASTPHTTTPNLPSPHSVTPTVHASE